MVEAFTFGKYRHHRLGTPVLCSSGRSLYPRLAQAQALCRRLVLTAMLRAKEAVRFLGSLMPGAYEWYLLQLASLTTNMTLTLFLDLINALGHLA